MVSILSLIAIGALNILARLTRVVVSVLTWSASFPCMMYWLGLWFSAVLPQTMPLHWTASAPPPSEHDDLHDKRWTIVYWRDGMFVFLVEEQIRMSWSLGRIRESLRFDGKINYFFPGNGTYFDECLIFLLFWFTELKHQNTLRLRAALTPHSSPVFRNRFVYLHNKSPSSMYC